MKGRKTGGRSDIEQFFEYARRREERPALKPLNYTFEAARRPDQMIPERPRRDITAADAAMREIREYATKARELYRERRQNDKPIAAREYVRHQLALGMLDAPIRRGLRPAGHLAAEPEPVKDPPRPRFGFWRRGPSKG